MLRQKNQRLKLGEALELRLSHQDHSRLRRALERRHQAGLALGPLQQGKIYMWEAGASAMAWAQQGVTLSDVTGPDNTAFQMGSLRIQPMQPGTFILVFAFDVQGKCVEQSVASAWTVTADFGAGRMGIFTATSIASACWARAASGIGPICSSAAT